MMAVWLAASLPLVAGPASAGTAATLSGFVLDTGTDAPIVGARVHAGEADTGIIHTSPPVEERGTYSIDGLPPGSYRLAVEADGKLFVVREPISLDDGEERVYPLKVDTEADPGVPAVGEAEAELMSFWSNPLLATLVVIGAATFFGFVIEEATDSETKASP